ncbi:hypothetical protein ABBQ32_011980 [Trebouxia sp. C0010 RCD-2024]
MMQRSEFQLKQQLQQLQGIAEDLQSSILRHSQLVTPAAPLDLRCVLKYAHKIAYTSFAPLGHDVSQPLPQHFRPPNPQEWQLRASQLHPFQAEYEEQLRQAQAAAAAAAGVMPASASPPRASAAAPKLPPGLKIPSMPKGWKPGMPIPGLEVANLLPAPTQEPTPPTAASHAQLVHSDQVQRQHVPAKLLPVADRQAALELPLPPSHPQQEVQPVAKPAALLPHPVIPDFELNPGMEAVEEEYSSSEEEDED